MLFDPEATAEVDRLAKSYADELIAFRRDLHAHPELGREEFRTTQAIANRLGAAGLDSLVFPTGTGLLCDIGDPDAHFRRVALRADLDALPLTDNKEVPYRSTRPGVCHACGHDVHAAIVLGAGLVLSKLAIAGLLRSGVRLIFQPAEELLPGGALDVMAANGLDGIDSIFAVHSDPGLDAGMVGLTAGSLTSAADFVHVRLTGPGGHTSRPHLTADLVCALATLVSQLLAALSRRVDPRSGISLVWGRIHAGTAPNAIPPEGEAEGTARCLDAEVWESFAELVPSLAHEIVAPFGVGVEVELHRGVPPVVNDPVAVSVLHKAAATMLGRDAVASTEQSLGGEDFAWYLTKVRGAMVRLGVRTPGNAAPFELHQGTFDVDEHSISVGVRVLVAAALLGGKLDADALRSMPEQQP